MTTQHQGPDERAQTPTHESTVPSKMRPFALLFLLLCLPFFLSLPAKITGQAGGGEMVGCMGYVPPNPNDGKQVQANLGVLKQGLTSTLTASADTYIQLNNAGPFGGAVNLMVKKEKNGTGDNVRKALIKFTMNASEARRNIDAALDLRLTHQASDQTFTFNVYGIKTTGTCATVGNDFQEATARYNQIPTVDSSMDGVRDDHECLFRPASVTSGPPRLGIFQTAPSQIGKTISFQSAALTEYIQHQGGQAATDSISIVLMLTLQQNHSTPVYFEAKEHSASNPPKLRTAYQAPQDTLTTTGDTYIQLDNAGPFGASADIVVKKDNSDRTERRGLIKFRVNNMATKDNPYAKLMLDVSYHPWASATYNVWGLKTGAGCQTMDFDEATAKYTDIGVADRSGDGVDNSAPCLYPEKLGTFTVTNSQVGQTVTFTSQKMGAYINEQIDQSPNHNTTTVVFMLSRQEVGAQTSHFASKEHASLNPPRLKFTDTVPGAQTVCGQTCNNCPQKAFTATCTLTTETKTYPYPLGTMKKLKITTMGKTFSLYGNWTNDSANGQKKFRTGGVIQLATSKGDIPLTPLTGQTITVTCEPYLTIEGQVGSLPGLNGIDGIDPMSLVNTPTMSLGVRLGTHLKEDYKTTPFNDCRPYFFVAVDTALGIANFKLNKKLGIAKVNALIAFDPADPSYITELGGEPVKLVSGGTLKDVGWGFSWQRNLQWSSAVPLPKSIAAFDTLETVTLNGHLYNHVGAIIPTGIKPLVDADVFFDLSALGTLTKARINEINGAVFKNDLVPLGTQALDQISFGFNINTVAILIADVIKFDLSSGSYVRKGDVVRFSGYLKTPSLSTPKIIASASTAAYNFVDKIFDTVTDAANARIEVQGVVEKEFLVIPKYRVKMNAKGKLLGLMKLSTEIGMTFRNTDEQGNLGALYGHVFTRAKMQDFTKNVVSASFDLQGTVDFSGTRGIYTNISGSTNMTVGNVEVVNVSMAISNKNVSNGEASLSGKLKTKVVNATLYGKIKGTGDGTDFVMTGSADINLVPVMSVVSLGTEELVNAAKTGYHCTEAYAQCGWNYVWKTVSNVSNCARNISCKSKCGIPGAKVCCKWTCEVKSGYKSCFKCRQKYNTSITLPTVKMSLAFTLRDSTSNPLATAANVVTGAVTGAAVTVDNTARKVCYDYPEDYIKNKVKEKLGIDASDLLSVGKKFCKAFYDGQTPN